MTHTGENKRAGTEVKQRILSDGLNRKTSQYVTVRIFHCLKGAIVI